MKYAILVLMLFSIFCGKINNWNKFISEEEYHLYSVVIDSFYHQSANFVIIEDSTSVDVLPFIQDWKSPIEKIFTKTKHEELIEDLLQKSKTIDENCIGELVYSYRDNNKSSIVLENHFFTNRPIKFIQSDSVKYGRYASPISISRRKLKPMFIIKEFYNDTAGILKFSRPGFNEHGDKAILLVKTSHFAHWDLYFIFFTKEYNTWKILDIVVHIKTVT